MNCGKEFENAVSQIEPKAWKIGTAFLKGVLLEVSSHPKPGLVSSISSGSHRDMDILTFMVSSAAISPAFFLCAQAGRNHKGAIEDLLPGIRRIGVLYEKELLKATGGVNTQRGILFAAGLLCGVAGYLSREKEDLKAEELFRKTAEMTRGIVDRELEQLTEGVNRKLTAGELLYKKYGATGIRGEVEAGLPSVAKVGLPAFKEALQNCSQLNDCLVHTLLALMTSVDDTTILWRKDQETLIMVKEKAKEVLEKGSVFTKEGLETIKKLDEEFVRENISPGGSADLVAVTASVYLLEKESFPVPIL